MKNNRPDFLKITQIASIVIFSCVFMYMLVFSLFFSRTERSIYDENLTEFPDFTWHSFLTGNYTSNLSKYLTDTIHNRDEFKSTASKIRFYFGIEQDEYNFEFDDDPNNEFNNWFDDDISFDVSDDYSNDVPEESSNDTVSNDSSTDISTDTSNDTDQSLPEESTSEESSKPQDTSKPAEVSKPSQNNNNNNDNVNNTGIVVIGKGNETRALEVIPAVTYFEGTIQRYARLIDNFANTVSPDGVKVYSMVVPKPCAFYIQESKKYASQWRNGLDIDEKIKSQLTKAIYVDAYHALDAHKDEEIYARTDFHWSGLGAFYAGEAFAKVAGVSYAPITEYDINRRPGYYGNMYAATKYFAPIKDNPEDLITMVPKKDYKAYYYNVKYQYNKTYTENVKNSVFVPISQSNVTSWYLTHIGGDYNVVRIETGLQTGRKLLILKDSYGDALAPLFMSSFDQVFIADLRYIEFNAIKFIKENGITDVLFGISSNTAVTGLNKNIERIMKI